MNLTFKILIFKFSVNTFATNCMCTMDFRYTTRFGCLRCAAGGHFVSARGSLRAPGVTLVDYKGDNISKYFCPTVIIDIARKITKLPIFKILMRHNDVITW